MKEKNDILNLLNKIYDNPSYSQRNLANKLGEELKAKYEKIENNTSINKMKKITEKSNIYILNEY